MRRRNFIQHSTLAALGLATSFGINAGTQLEEPLTHSVRTALSAAVAQAAPPEPVFTSSQQAQQYRNWHKSCTRHLARKLSDERTRHELLQTVWYEAKRAALEPSLVMGLIQVESNFRKHAISVAGARGYMQVMPFWAKLIGDGDAGKLFHAQTNLRFGCVILRHYLQREKGDLFMALGRYNGSRGQPRYPNAVLTAQRLWHA